MTEEDLLRWTDDLLEGERLEAVTRHLEAQPGLRAELEGFKLVGDALRAEIPARQEPPYHDFFNTRVMRVIQDEQNAHAASVAPRPSLFAKLRWLSLPIAAGALALSFVAGMNMSPTSYTNEKSLTSNEEAEPSIYVPLASLQANVVTGADHEVNLIVLDGLNDIPDDVSFSLSAVEEESSSGYILVKHTDNLL